MKFQAKTLAIIVIVNCLFVEPLGAMHESGHDLTDEEWLIVKGRLDLLDGVNYMPTLLPTIMRHRDVLELTKQQIKSFRNWRKQHYGDMVMVMNTIINKRIDFKKASLNPKTSEVELVEMQSDILSLHKKLLEIKLSCRKMIVDSFTEEQWDNFAFAVADNPKLASLIQQ
jgi:hypothetical protein